LIRLGDCIEGRYMDPFVTSDYVSNPVFLTYAVVNSIFISGHVLSKSCQEYSGITKN